MSCTGNEFCHLETFRARCQHGDVIVMATALFGRMRVGRCITSNAYLTALQQLDPTTLGCSADVLGYVDRVCSGRSTCEISVASPQLHEFRPCPEQLTMYLEATYSCLTGQMLYNELSYVLRCTTDERRSLNVHGPTCI